LVDLKGVINLIIVFKISNEKIIQIGGAICPVAMKSIDPIKTSLIKRSQKHIFTENRWVH